LFVSPPFVVCQPSTDPPTCCCPPLPETTTHTYTRTHIARVACAGISAVHVGASRRHVGFIFCPP
jgi:hypothetical protein